MIITGAILGAVLGYVLQRGRFCVTGFLRDVWLTRSTRGIAALFLVIAVHAVGVWALTWAGVIAPEPETFSPSATIVGGLVFGYGIVLAGGCATGTYYRAGEGLVGSWIALAAYALSAAFMTIGPAGAFTDGLRDRTVGHGSVQADTGVPVIALVVALVAVTAWLVHREVSRPTPPIPQLPPRTSGLAHLLAEKPWGLFTTAAVVGVIGVLAWPLSTAAGRNGGLGITTPSAHLVGWFGTGEATYLNWGTLLVVGIIAGSYIAARASGEFRVRVPDAGVAVRSAWGGVAMGAGAALAGGCTVGNGMVATGLFSWQGWVSLAAMLLGCGLATRRHLMRRPLLPSAASVRAALRVPTSTPSRAVGGPSAAPVDDAGGVPAGEEHEGEIADARR